MTQADFGQIDIQQAGTNFLLAAGINPDAEAKALRNATVTGVPLQMARDNPKLDITIEAAQALRQQYSPTLTGLYAASPSFAAIARGDHSKLFAVDKQAGVIQGLADAFNNGGTPDYFAARLLRSSADQAYRPNTLEGIRTVVYPTLSQAFKQGSEYQIERSMIWYQKMLNGGVGTPEQDQRLAELDAKYKDYAQAPGFFRGGLQNAAELLPQMIEANTSKEAITRIEASALAFGATALIAGQAGPQAALPEETVSVPGAMAVGAGRAALANTAIFAYQLETGQAYAELMTTRDTDGNTMDPKTAAIAANAYGVIAAGIEMAQVEKLARLVPGLKQGESTAAKKFLFSRLQKALEDKTLVKKLAELGFENVSTAAFEGTTGAGQQALQEITNYIARDIANAQGQSFENQLFTKENFDQISQSFAAAFRGSLFLGAAPTIVSAAKESGIAIYNKQVMEQHLKLSQLIEDSATKARSPEAMAAVLAARGPNASVFIDGEDAMTLMQDGKADLTKAGITRDQIETANASGNSVELPVAEVQAKMSDAEKQVLFQHTRLLPDAMSLAELADMDAAKEAKKLADRMTAITADERTFQGHMQRLTSELKGLGVAPDQAQSNLSLIEAASRRWSLEQGRNVATLAEKLSFVKGEGDTLTLQPNELGQIDTTVTQTPEFKNWLGSSALISADTKDQVLYHGTGERRGIYDGIFLTDSPADAAGYAELKAVEAWVNRTPELEDIVNEIMSEEGADSLTDLGPERIKEIADANGFDIPKDIGGYREAFYVKAKNLLDLRDMGSSVGDVQETWDALHARGLLDESWSSLDEGTQQELQDQYDGKALYKFLEDEGVQAKAFEKGYDAVAFVDQGFYGDRYGSNQHDAWLVKSGDQLKSINNRGTFDPNSPNVFEQNQGKGPRGSVTLYDNKYLVKLFESADSSTIPHELAHVFLEEMKSIVDSGVASSDIVSDFGKIQSWLGVTLEQGLTRDHHEQFAQTFEQYLREGKAPVVGLDKVFNNFRRWLTAVYKTVVGAKAKLNPDISGVFDRMLATQQEIEQSAADLNMVVLTDEQIAAMKLSAADTEKIKIVRDRAVNTIADKQAKYDNRSLDKRMKRWRRNARKTMDAMPVYRAIKYLRSGKLYDDKGGGVKGPDGKPVEAVTGLALAQTEVTHGSGTVKDLRKKFGNKIVQENGSDIEAVARGFGYQDSTEMIVDMMNAKPIKQFTAEVVKSYEDRYAQHFGVKEKLAGSAHMTEYLETVGQYIARSAKATENNATRRTFKRVAAQVFDQMQTDKALATRTLVNNLQRAVKKMQAALLASDFKTALEQNHKARLLVEQVKLSMELNQQRDQMLKKAKRAMASRTLKMDNDHREAIRQLGLQYRMVRGDVASALPGYVPSEQSAEALAVQAARSEEKFQAFDAPKSPDPNRTPLAELVQKDTTATVRQGMSFPDWLVNSRTIRSYKELSVSSFNELNGLVGYLYGMGRELAGDSPVFSGQNLDEVTARLAEPAQALTDKQIADLNTKLGAVLRLKELGIAQVDSLPFLMRMMDAFVEAKGGAKPGPNATTITYALDRAFEDYSRIKREVNNKLADLQAYIDKRDKEFGHKLDAPIPVPERYQRIGVKTWSYRMVMAVLANVGDDYNLKAMMDGFGWDYTDVEKILSVLTPEDLKTMEAMAATLRQFRPQLEATYKRVTFKPLPKWYEGRPIVINGQELSGWYWPAAYNLQADERYGGIAENVLENYEAQESMAGVFHTVPVLPGFTNDRAGSGGRPIMLSLAPFDRHVEQSVKFITHAEAINDIQRVFRHPAWRDTFVSKFGKAKYDVLFDILNKIFWPDRGHQGPIDRLFERWRHLTATYFLWGKPSIAAQQALSLANTIAENPGAVASGYHQAFTNPVEVFRFARENSEYIRHRFSLIDKDALETHFTPLDRNRKRLLGIPADAIAETGVAMMQAVDAAVVIPAWHGFYRSGLKLFEGDHELAVSYANDKVAQTNPSGRPMDLSNMQLSKKGFARLFTMFSNWSFLAGGLLSRRARFEFAAMRQGQISIGSWVGNVFLEQVVPAALASVMFPLLRGEDIDKKELTADIVLYQFGGLPIIRDAAFLAGGVFKGKRPDTAVNSPMLAGLELYNELIVRSLALTNSLGSDNTQEWHDAAWAWANMLSFELGVPVSRIANQTIRGLDQLENDDGTWFNVLVPSYKNPKD